MVFVPLLVSILQDVAVYCEVGAQAEHWTWFYCQEPGAIKAQAASRQQGSTWSEQDHQIRIGPLGQNLATGHNRTTWSE